MNIILMPILIAAVLLIQHVLHNIEMKKLEDSVNNAWGDGKEAGEKAAMQMFKKAYKEIKIESERSRNCDGQMFHMSLIINRYDKNYKDFEK